MNVRDEVTTTAEHLSLDPTVAAGASPTGATTSPKIASFTVVQNQRMPR